ncbi:transcriptional regulator [Sphaerisporangium melleum]|uniref:Transcriptional regulator n=1 Tax=Sphaerisporangium melleum TaxID=321316 RepID=A0A917R0G4_9ACTN|nr:XRE family transcriptional regulator [Sphaerisporangium melleum]GGK79380.1 transcriptional regulator [Sphaerisporangium melleum]GII69709.1 transcriptional regulator [Sphaerisporangium melleum]
MSALDWTEIGERVRESRLAMRLSQEQLAEAIGLDRTMISKIEAGVRRLDALELARLARALDHPVAHFLTPAPAVMSRRTPLAEDTTTDAAQISYRMDTALASWIREIQLLVSLDALELRPIKRYPGKVDGRAAASAAAGWLRNELSIGIQPVRSLADLCERCGQYLMLTDLPGDGASAVDGDVAAAVISMTGEPGRRRTTAAHELGHLVLGDEYSSDLGVHASRDEREAVVDTFAAELLLPVKVVADAHGKHGSTRSALVHLAAEYRTSWSLALRQARAAEVIGKADEATLRACPPTFAEFRDSLGWTPQPDLDSIRVSPGFAHAVMTAYRNGDITSRRAMELMHGELTSESELPPRTDEDDAP